MLQKAPPTSLAQIEDDDDVRLVDVARKIHRASMRSKR
jgi:hypothetical protein